MRGEHERKRERGGVREKEKEREGWGVGGKREFMVSINSYFVSDHSNIDYDLLKVVLHSDRYRSPSARYTIRARSLTANVSLQEDEGCCLDNG